METVHRVQVKLGKKDLRRVTAMLAKGRESARVLRRALVLRLLDQGQAGARVARNLGVARKTVRAIARRFLEEGLDAALRERPRTGKPRALDAGQQQRVVALACSPPPAGRARWTVRLIAEEAVKRKLTPPVSRETVRLLLQSHDLKPWREKNVVRGGPR